MKRAGKVLMAAGSFIAVTGACAIDSDGAVYSKVLLIMMIGIVVAVAGYGLICLEDMIPDMKKSHPIMLWRAGAIHVKTK